MDKKVFCEQCDTKVDFYVDTTETTREVKELEITLVAPVPKCMTCKGEIFVEEIDIEAQDMFFAEYKRRKGLIQTKDIISIRQELGVSQRDLSKLLGLGEITISRYELGSIPTKVNSMIIESLKDRKRLESLIKENVTLLSEKGQRSIQLYLDKTKSMKYTGNRQYSKTKFSQLTAFFIELAKKYEEKLYVTKLNKLLFYADFNYFRKFEVSITGSKYIKLSYGPVPNKYEFKYDMNPYIMTEIIDDKVQYKLYNKIDYEDLTESELIIAEAVYKRFKNVNSNYISNISHKEEGWLKTELGKEISYDFSINLKIIV